MTRTPSRIESISGVQDLSVAALQIEAGVVSFATAEKSINELVGAIATELKRTQQILPLEVVDLAGSPALSTAPLLTERFSRPLKVLKSLAVPETSVDTILDGIDDNTFGAAVCRGLFSRLSEKGYAPLLKKLSRVLVPDGLLFVQDHFPISPEVCEEMNDLLSILAGVEGRSTNGSVPTISDFYGLLDAHDFKPLSCVAKHIHLPLVENCRIRGITGRKLEVARDVFDEALRHSEYMSRDYRGREILVRLPATTIAAVNEKTVALPRKRR